VVSGEAETPIAPVEADDPIVVASVPEPIVAAASVPAPKPKAEAEPESPRLAPAPSAARTPLTTSAILMLIWAAVSTALFARFLRSVWVTRRLIRDAVPVPEDSGWFPVD